jgi:uncharacterized protein YkwD
MRKAMVMRVRLVLCIVALAIAGGPAALSATAKPPLRNDGVRTAALANDVVAEINAARAKRGLVALRVSPGLVAAAAHHSREMAQGGYFEHRSADGSAFWKRVARFYPSGRGRAWSVGENLLWSSPTIDAPGALRMWMESPGHRKNMLDAQWREIGISVLRVQAAPGVFKGLEVTLVTADFGIRG